MPQPEPRYAQPWIAISVRRVTVRRRRIALSRELLMELYATQGLTLKAIAKLLGGLLLGDDRSQQAEELRDPHPEPALHQVDADGGAD